MRIPCPFCGPRDLVEFSYGGDAGRERPPMTCTDEAAWFEFVYLRDNPRGPHREYWQHVQGCRQWLRVERDTLTHEIGAVTPAAPESVGPTPLAPGTDGGAA